MSLSFSPHFADLRNEISQQLGDSWRYYSGDLDLLIHLRRLGFQPSMIYDIGASNTVWSVMASLVFSQAQFELFEPLAEISDAYNKKKRTHPAIREFLANKTYRIHPIALGAFNGTTEFHHFEGDAGSTSLEMDHAPANARKLKIPMRRLDDYVRDQEILPPDLIKMDTQGAEAEIIKGGANAFRQASAVFIECWLAKGYGKRTPLLATIANLLSKFGFDLFDFGDEFRADDGTLQAKDVLFLKRDIPLIPVKV